MSEIKQVYRCPICGQIVEILHGATPELVCCGLPMELLSENTVDAAVEKHVPVIKELNEQEVKVVVGETLHPMEENHYIEWIEIIIGDYVARQFLKPGEAPEAVFKLPMTLDEAKQQGLKARAYCNLHGLWKEV